MVEPYRVHSVGCLKRQANSTLQGTIRAHFCGLYNKHVIVVMTVECTIKFQFVAYLTILAKAKAKLA
jgi:hypothetical protein